MPLDISNYAALSAYPIRLVNPVFSIGYSFLNVAATAEEFITEGPIGATTPNNNWPILTNRVFDIMIQRTDAVTRPTGNLMIYVSPSATNFYLNDAIPIPATGTVAPPTTINGLKLTGWLARFSVYNPDAVNDIDCRVLIRVRGQ